MSGEAPADAWTGDERKRAIDALWSDVERLRQDYDQEQLHGNRRPVTKNEMAKAVGVSNSTLGDWLNKRTVVPDWPELEKLIRFLGGRPDEWQPRWRRAMSAYQTRPRGRTSKSTTADLQGPLLAATVAPDVDESEVPDGLGGPARRHWRKPLQVLILFSVVALIAVVLLLVLRPGTNGPARTWQATVVNTWSSSRQKDIGIRPYLHPSRADQTYPGYFTSDVVSVACHYDKGRSVQDKTTLETSSVWYRLNDGFWLPGLFLQFEGRLGTTAPSRMPACKP